LVTRAQKNKISPKNKLKIKMKKLIKIFGERRSRKKKSIIYYLINISLSLGASV
jgi:hypothetical protein